MGTARYDLAGCGTTTAGLIFGGRDPNKNETETWNGTNWTEVNNLNTARCCGIGFGTQTAAIFGGGSPPNAGLTELWLSLIHI